MESCVPSDASRLGNDLCNGGRSSEALRNDTMTVDQLIKTRIAKLGENIAVSRFARFKVGDAFGPAGGTTAEPTAG